MKRVAYCRLRLKQACTVQIVGCCSLIAIVICELKFYSEMAEWKTTKWNN